MEKPKILAQATVELLEKGPVESVWEVEVWGGPAGGEEHRRVYTIAGKTDNNAAHEGIRQFCIEVENLSTNVSERN